MSAEWITDEARETAARAIWLELPSDYDEPRDYMRHADAALNAVAPFVAGVVRQALIDAADELDLPATYDGGVPTFNAWSLGRRDAAHFLRVRAALGEVSS